MAASSLVSDDGVAGLRQNGLARRLALEPARPPRWSSSQRG